MNQQTLVGKRILLLAERNPFPQDTPTRTAALALLDAGYQVVVICRKEEGQSWQEEYRGAQVYRYPALPRGKAYVTDNMKESYALLVAFLLSLVVLLRDGFDVIQAQNPPAFWLAIAGFYRRFGKHLIGLSA